MLPVILPVTPVGSHADTTSSCGLERVLLYVADVHGAVTVPGLSCPPVELMQYDT
jgi:hypothetical protein